MSNRKVCISGYASVVQDSADQTIIDKGNRKLMRFARKSGQIFLKSILNAIEMSGIEIKEIDSKRIALFFSDFMNLITDVEKIIAVLKELTDNECEYDKESFVKNISDSWSVIEVLKNVPNIPAFIACQEIGVKGVSSTELSSCAGGLYSLIDGCELIMAGKADVVFVGASSDKINYIEIPILNSIGFFNEGDYFILNGAAVLILESEEHVKKRNGNILAYLGKYQTSFSPLTYLNRKFDSESIKYILDSFMSTEKDITDYVIGTFSRILLPQEIDLLSQYKLNIKEADSFKSKYGYTFAASGLMEIIHLFNRNFSANTIVNSFGLGGQNASLIIKSCT